MMLIILCFFNSVNLVNPVKIFFQLEKAFLITLARIIKKLKSTAGRGRQDHSLHNRGHFHIEYRFNGAANSFSRSVCKTFAPDSLEVGRSPLSFGHPPLLRKEKAVFPCAAGVSGISVFFVSAPLDKGADGDRWRGDLTRLKNSKICFILPPHFS